jgi:glycosyltransferase involved in cell wall biosynthesis
VKVAVDMLQSEGSSDQESHQSFPLVAVVTPVYNGMPYIERTLLCVQQQSYRNLVHVVLDNASTDGTADAIAAAMNGRVPIITKRNTTLLRQFDNWNASIGLTPPGAKYVNFLAADDLIRADAIERLVACAESDEEIDFVTAVDVFNDNLKPHGLVPGRTIYSGEEYARAYLRKDISWQPATHVFFRVTPERLANPFDTVVGPPLADCEFIISDLVNRKIGLVEAPLFYTRYTESSVTAQSGGFRSYILPDFERFLRHAPKFLEPAEIKALTKKQFHMLLRHVLLWRRQGMQDAAFHVVKRLTELGYKPTTADYAAAVLGWPEHKLKKALARAAERSRYANGRLTEEDFLSYRRTV